jgi:integrase
MIRLQQFSGMRPGEVVRMRLADIDRSAETWVYTLQKHKTAHHGHARMIFLGPKAQQVLAPFLTLDPNRYLFSAADAESERRDRRRERRRTPIGLGNGPGSNRVSQPQRKPGEHYTVRSYRRAIQRACDASDQYLKAGMVIGLDERLVPRWHPHQLRHAAATDVRKEFGIEGAQVLLGHKTLKMTELYAEKSAAHGRKIAQQIG